MSDALQNPFPLGIEDKQDSFEKLMLMANVPASFKVNAVEFTKIIKALEWLYSHGAEGTPTIQQTYVQQLLSTGIPLLSNPGAVLTVIGQLVGQTPISRFATAEDLQSFFPPGFLLQPVITWSGVGLLFYGSRALFNTGQNIIPIPFKGLTLANGNATHDRIDSLYVDLNTYTYEVDPGTPAADPVPPMLPDGPTLDVNRIFIKNIRVEANATAPVGITTEIVFDENVAPDWTPSIVSDSSQATADFNNTEAVFTGSKAAKVEFNNESFIQLKFERATDFNGVDFTAFGFALNFFEVPDSDTGFINGLRIAFYNAAGAIIKLVNPVVDTNTTGTYQVVSIAGNQFADVTGARSVGIIWRDQTIPGFYIDRVYFQGGISQPVESLILPEERVIGNTVILTGVTGTYEIDLSLGSYFHITLSGNTDFTFINAPANDKTQAKSFKIIAPAEETYEFPAYVEALDGGAPDATKTNFVTINFARIGSTLEGIAAYSTLV